MDERFISNGSADSARIEASLRGLSPANRDRARVLGMFHGGVHLDVPRIMMQWERVDAGSLADELIATGLARRTQHNHLSLDPALCPYLRAQLDTAEYDALTIRWNEAMRGFVGFIVQQQNQHSEIAAALTLLELPNLLALLEHVQRDGHAAATIELATSLYGLLQALGKPRELERVAQARDAAAAALGAISNHAGFEAQRTRIEEHLAGGRVSEAADGARQLLQRSRAAGDKAYPEAGYDLAMACILLARSLRTAGGVEQALPLLDEAQQLFEASERDQPGRGAERMLRVCLTERGGCLLRLGRLDAAAAAYEEGIRRAGQRRDERGAAVGHANLGTVRQRQHRYKEALDAAEQARERFTRMEEPGSVAGMWHQTGRVYEETGQLKEAEDAYRRALAGWVRLGNPGAEAATLGQLGLLADALGQPEEAVALLRQAAEKHRETGDAAGEGQARSNLAARLEKLGRLDVAREEVRLAIQCKEQFGHASEPWKTWDILADIERDAGNAFAAAAAKGKATACYLAYRHDGGENHNADGRIGLAMIQRLLSGGTAEAVSVLRQAAADPETAPLRPFLDALEAVIGGSRDRDLSGAPDLDYMMAAEVLFLIDTLERAAG